MSRRHADFLRLSDGRPQVADRATTNGTFGLDAGEEWREVCQAFVEASGRIRFGDCRMSVAQLDAVCPPGRAGRFGSGSARQPDPTRGLVFDPQTGEVVEKEPRRGGKIRR